MTCLLKLSPSILTTFLLPEDINFEIKCINIKNALTFYYQENVRRKYMGTSLIEYRLCTYTFIKELQIPFQCIILDFCLFIFMVCCLVSFFQKLCGEIMYHG